MPHFLSYSFFQSSEKFLSHTHTHTLQIDAFFLFLKAFQEKEILHRGARAALASAPVQLQPLVSFHNAICIFFLPKTFFSSLIGSSVKTLEV